MVQIGPIITRGAALALAVAIAATGTAPAAAQPRGLDIESDHFGAGPGSLGLAAIAKQALRGEAPPGVEVERLDNGLTRVVVPLPADSPLRRKAAKRLVNCALTVDLFTPDLTADTVSFDVAPIDEFEYSVGWVTLNTTADDIDANSQIRTKGPGPDLNVSDTLTYRAGAFNLFFVTNSDGWQQGLHAIDAKVQGAKPGKLKGNFCAGCT